MIEDDPRVLEGLKVISNESRDFVDPKALGDPQVFYDPHSIFLQVVCIIYIKVCQCFNQLNLSYAGSV